MENQSYSKLSINLSKSIDKSCKQKEGIYFTSQNIINKAISRIQNHKKETLEEHIQSMLSHIEDDELKFKILEPSCGSCEFINTLSNLFPKCNIVGIEKNKTIFNEIQKLNFNNNNVNLINDDFIEYNTTDKYDLIIGNPPFFVIPKNSIDKTFYDYFTGRPNIFNIFIIKSLRLLNNNGILCFVLPKSFLNCIYYNKTRKHIFNSYKIIDIIPLNDDNFIDTTQETILFIIQNINDFNNHPFCVIKNDYVIFQESNKINIIKRLYEESTTLDEMGFNVSVGPVVWNQVKPELTDDSNKTLLIYTTNMKNKKIEETTFKDVNKKQYINRDGLTEMCLIVNRGYGNGDYKFNYVLLNNNKPYLLENHVICIKHKNTKLNKNKLLKQYQKIIQSFDNDKTQEFIRFYFSNNAMNTTELQHILPIY